MKIIYPLELDKFTPTHLGKVVEAWNNGKSDWWEWDLRREEPIEHVKGVAVRLKGNETIEHFFDKDLIKDYLIEGDDHV